MNGPDHYRAAERFVEQSHRADLQNGHAAWLVAAAQVHATLALAAATVEPAGWQPGEFPGWREAVS